MRHDNLTKGRTQFEKEGGCEVSIRRDVWYRDRHRRKVSSGVDDDPLVGHDKIM